MVPVAASCVADGRRAGLPLVQSLWTCAMSDEQYRNLIRCLFVISAQLGIVTGLALGLVLR